MEMPLRTKRIIVNFQAYEKKHFFPEAILFLPYQPIGFQKEMALCWFQEVDLSKKRERSWYHNPYTQPIYLASPNHKHHDQNLSSINLNTWYDFKEDQIMIQ